MFIGFDTSNYTTSVAAFDSKRMIQHKKLLDVKAGERGLRQSEALFQHTVNIPALFDRLKDDLNYPLGVKAIAVSNRPRSVEGSYMPCFLAGESAASACAALLGVTLYKTSHQTGHILAALYSAGRLDLVNEPFISFHLSGGTTEALLVKPDNNEIIKVTAVAQSLDLKAGQVVDRTGVLLGLKFPCGAELDKMAAESDAEFNIKPSMKGLDCSLSGVENKVKKMLADSLGKNDIAKFAVCSVCAAVDAMTDGILKEYGNLPVVFAGGVSSNSMLRKKLGERYNAYFAERDFSCDNAAGVAVYAKLKFEKG